MSRTGLGYIVASPVLFVSPQKYSCPPLTAMLYVAPAWIEETPWARQKYSLRVSHKNHRVRDLNWIVCLIFFFTLPTLCTRGCTQNLSVFSFTVTSIHPPSISATFYEYLKPPSHCECFVLSGIESHPPSVSAPFYAYSTPPSLYQCFVLRIFKSTLHLSVLRFNVNFNLPLDWRRKIKKDAGLNKYRTPDLSKNSKQTI